MQAASLAPSAGWQWVRDGLALFRQQPMAMFTWALTVGFMVLVASIIKPIGPLLFIAGMPFGYSIGWAGQTRDDHVVPWGVAMRQLWPHTAIGVGALAILAATHPGAIPYALLLAGGPALSIPFAVLTSSPGLGAALARIGIGRLPEETTPPLALATLALPALGATEPAA